MSSVYFARTKRRKSWSNANKERKKERNVAHSRSETLWTTVVTIKLCPHSFDASLMLRWCCVVKLSSAGVDGVCVPRDHSSTLPSLCFYLEVGGRSLVEVTEVLDRKMASGYINNDFSKNSQHRLWMYQLCYLYRLLYTVLSTRLSHVTMG